MVVNVVKEKERLEKLSEEDLFREISALIKQLSEIQIRLNAANQVHAARNKKTKEGALVHLKIQERSGEQTPKSNNKDIKDLKKKKGCDTKHHAKKDTIKDFKDKADANYTDKEHQKNESFDQPNSYTVRSGYIYTEPSLPKGWGMKVRSTNAWTKKNVCNPEGKVFESKRQAYLYALSSGLYSNQDLELLKSPFSEAVWKEEVKSKIRDKVRLNNFNYEDDTLPEHWGSRQIFHKGKSNMILICSPEGRQFTSKVKAFEHMISNIGFYDATELDVMKKNLKEHELERTLKRFEYIIDE